MPYPVTPDQPTSAANSDLDTTAAGIGGVADAAVTNPASSGSTIALLKGLLTRFGTTLGFDNTNELKASLYGKNSAAGDTAMQLNSDGSQYMDLRRAAGTALAISNPVMIETNIQNAIRNGQGYAATTGSLTSTSGNAFPLSIFNPSGSGKNILIFSLKVSATGGQFTLDTRAKTTDPAFSTALTPVNLKIGGSASVLTSSVTTVNSNQTISGTQIEYDMVLGNTSYELLTNGDVILLPNGSAEGLTLYLVTGASGNYVLNAKWIEF